uniref:Neurotransmitter-gated ion-channel ligand-binding domain-containing protein n=1 Tax=Anopheles coluzzii TaxID=1518534 RepID=A0A8W7Q3C6_ANOCL
LLLSATPTRHGTMLALMLQYANKLLITYIPADHNCIELHRCKQHNAINGYNYRAFFKLHELDHHNPANADLIVDLLVYVLAARDGHILLSEQNKTAPTALEIVLGGGGNTFSQIRFGQKGSPLRTKASAGLLSPIDPLPVRVRINTEGQVRVYAGNLTGEPFMETMMPKKNASELRYVSFTTWGTALAKWFYDCPLPANSTNGTALIDGNELEQEFDGKQRLLDHLLGVPRWIDPPVNFSGVQISQMYIQGFVYDQTTNLVELSGAMGLSWKDPRYRWNASDFDNTTVVGDVCHLIWTPSFQSASLFTGTFSLCYLSNEGTVIVEMDEFSWANFCTLSDSYRWPYDTNACHLQLLTASHERHVPMHLAIRSVQFDPEYEQSEWSVKTIGKHEYEQTVTPYGQQPMLQLHIEMMRKSDIHSVSIYPSYFDLFFEWSLVFYTISSIFFAIELWLKRTRTNIPPGSWIGRVISFPALRFALAMDQRSNYNTLEHKNVRWDEVTCILNRIMMLVVVIVFAIGFSKP